MKKLSEAVKQAIIQMAGSGMSVDKILDMLKSKGIEMSLEEVVEVIMSSGKVEEKIPEIDNPAEVLKWMINKQVGRLNKLLSIESISPLPLPETTNNLKILADLVVKYSELVSKGVSVEDLKRKIFEGADEV